jgi:hypothetical protein
LDDDRIVDSALISASGAGAVSGNGDGIVEAVLLLSVPVEVGEEVGVIETFGVILVSMLLNFFSLLLMMRPNKLECLYLAITF